MNKKKILLVLIIATTILFVAYFYCKKGGIKHVSIKGKEYKVEIVKTSKDLQKGLGDRSDLCSNCGMLFVFGNKGKYNFWMKDMHFPLDIIWIYDGKIVHMEKNISPDDKRILAPGIEADSVLEINAGQADEFGFEIGDDASVLIR